MSKLINEHLIKLDVSESSKRKVIIELAELINVQNRLYNLDGYLSEVFRRERLSTTGIGYGIAIPHGKCKDVKKPTIAFGRLKKGVDWDSVDGKPVNLVFLLAVPQETDSKQHLETISALSRKLVNEEFRHALLSIDSKDKFISLFNSIFKDR
ncbi:PTS sugar transporter subunit IIA [Caldisalinibacter kiritimatiensis]|uniref:Transcriptional antiterminator of lichenan operon, BglG family n=1 Tax=Caldisalinibacter kiritimatiensis TaxID=1304284 RepID=R1CLS1_9FIRM|nr:fructose PTS transporter subunit IIA [Caldisalinibacter kiritimatiensis]EOC99655.1 Transcriptional antiterminator of lichenan operon, BglG family [Caldisalinibacter kiritimatiensis]